MSGIVSFGAYVPRLRLQRAVVAAANAWFNPGQKAFAKGERAIANWDEDAVTMAVEAGRDCLAGIDRQGIAAVVLASTSAPFADRQNAGIVKEALNLGDQVGTLDYAGSQKAGTGALLQAFRAAAGTGGGTLCVAAEKRKARVASEAELTNGDAAAAFLVGSDRLLARFIAGHSLSADFVDHFRAADAGFDYNWESRWVRDEGYVKLGVEALKGALAAAGVAGGAIAHLIIGIPVKGVAETLAKAVGIPAGAVRDNLLGNIGNAGCAHPLLMLAHTLESAQPGDKILVLGFGQGCDVILLEATGAIRDAASSRRGVSGWLERRKAESNYLKYLSFAGHLALDTGMRAEFDQKQPLTALYRNRKTVLGLVGGRCKQTGTVQYPKSEITVGTTDVIGQFEDYPLAERPARIMTFTADSLAFCPDPPNYYGMIEFEGGGRMLTEFTDAEAEAIEVGAPVTMMFRIKAVDERRGFVKYFWKAVPAA